MSDSMPYSMYDFLPQQFILILLDKAPVPVNPEPP